MNYRLDRARAAELEEALRVLSAIKEVRAIVRTSQSSASSVSLVIQKKIGEVLDEASLTQMVLKAVPGVTPETIQLTVIDTSDIVIAKTQGMKNEKGITVSLPLVPFLGIFSVPESELSTLSLTIFAGVIFIAGLGAFLGYWFGFLQKTRVELDAEQAVTLPRLPRRGNDLPRIGKE